MSQTQGDLLGVKVLVIDDTENLRGALAYTLSIDGAVVETAGTVAEGLVMAEQAEPPYDVVIADNRIKGETSEGVKVTAYGLTARRLGARLLGWTMNPILPKPVDVFPGGQPDRAFGFVDKHNTSAQQLVQYIATLASGQNI